jgi:uncharacterized glyoxalase superfamily protein PhnB
MTQDAHGIWAAPGGAQVAWFKDPDGNVLSLTEEHTVRASVPRDNIVPELFVDDGARALAFYCAAFGATELRRMQAPDGVRLLHGELDIGGHRLFVVDEFPDVGTCRCPKTLGGTGVRITLEVADADSFVQRAAAAVATIMMPVTEMFWGARYAKLLDPFGHEWGINQQKNTLTDAEEHDNAKRFFAGS